ncbi:MAG: FeoB-associated Cys-rich membrane protein [Rikenellaceae bacterium]|nr:FeoB-associated Cys-rich membrane protein [Rikenellaceae bacterium]
MTWQDWAVAAIGVALVAWLVVRLVRRIQGKSKGSPCCNCGCADSCPSARKSDKCDSKNRK